MASDDADAFVFFGATGDLAYEQIFPALQAMAKTRSSGHPGDWHRQVRTGPSTSCASGRARASPRTADRSLARSPALAERARRCRRRLHRPNTFQPAAAGAG